MKNILLICLLIVVASCTETQSQAAKNQQIDDFLSEFDDKSLDEIKDEINANIKQFDAFVNFFDGAFNNEIEHVKKEDEEYNEAFKIDTTGLDNALHQFNEIQFTQTFSEHQSNLKFNFKNPTTEKQLLGQGVTEVFIPKKIYYHDGTTNTENIESRGIDFTFVENNWGPAKPIDSIEIDYKANYITNYEMVEISAENPKVNFRGGEIKLVKTQDNYVYLTLSDTIISPIETQGYTVEGKVLDRNGYSSNAINPKDAKDAFSKLVDYLKQIQKKLNDNDFKDINEFKAYIRKNLNQLSYFNDTDGLFHSEYYFQGNVKSVKLYFDKEEESKETKFMAHNIQSLNNDKELFQMLTNDGLVFLNNQGVPEITIKRSALDVTKIGGDFYEDYNYFYLLNRSEKRLDTLFVHNVKAFDNGLIGIQPEQKNDDFSLFTFDNKPISAKKYWNVKEVGNVVFGNRDDKFYILDDQGNETLVPGVAKIYDKLSEDRIMVANSDEKIGFINGKGNLIIAFKYDDAEDFEDGITAAKYNDTYKLIDINGKALLDTGEDYINFFEKDEQGKRIYKFNSGRKSYNYKGEWMEE